MKENNYEALTRTFVDVKDCDYENCVYWLNKKFNVTRSDIVELEDIMQRATIYGVYVHAAIDKFYHKCC